MNEMIVCGAMGLLLGFLFQKARILRFDCQVGAMRFRDLTFVKFLMSAALTGCIGLQLLVDYGLIKLSHPELNLGGLIVGGMVAGCGGAVAGFFPETALGAVGEGRWHALFVIAGMLVGAALYAEALPFLKQTVLAWKVLGRLAFPSLLGVSPWHCIAVFWGIGVVIFVWCEYKRV